MGLQRLVSAQEAFVARVTSSPAAVRKRAQWEQRGERYLRAYPTMPRGSLVQVDPRLQAQVLGMIAEVFPAVADTFTKHLVPIAERAFNEWPVKTGLSKSLLALEFGVDNPTTFRASIVARAPYTYFINRGRTVRELVFDPGEAAADAMADELAGLLA
jgi:hypothetical protein